MPASPQPPLGSSAPPRRSALANVGLVAIVAGAALVSLTVTWRCWIDPFVDSGREMNVPARVAAGERLYRDIVYYYGPAGPWLQALVLRAAGAAGAPPPGPSAAPTDGTAAADDPVALGAAIPHAHGAIPAPLGAGRSWLPLEIACLALAGAILVLLYRLASAAGSPRSALAATTLAAAFCLGAPHGGAFVFPYSAASLYALAGALLALDGSLRPPGWPRRALVAGGVGLALAARAEIGAATLVILLVSVLRSHPDIPAPRANTDDEAAANLGPRDGTDGSEPIAARDRAGRAHGVIAGKGAAVADLALGVAAALAVYAAAFSGVSWRLLLHQGPFTHVLAMPPAWRQLYAGVSGLAHPGRSLRELAWGLALDAALLAVCAWAGAAGSAATPAATAPSGAASPIKPSGAAPPAEPSAAARVASPSAAGAPPTRTRLLPRLGFALAAAALLAAWSAWGGQRGWPWARLADNLPPALFPLPLLAAAAALAMLARPFEGRGRARFMLFALAAALGARVVLGCGIGPAMTAYCALPLPPLLAAAAVLAADVLAPRLRDRDGFRFRLAVVAALLAGLYLYRLGEISWGPHRVPVETASGSLRLPWKEAGAVAGTLDYLAGRARPGDRLASFPEAGFFNFVTGMPNPLREEEIFPGVLDSDREAAATARLLASRPRFVLLANRPTPEYGPRAFGDDYAVSLWSAVEDRYSLAALFGDAAAGAPVGARRFFIRVYEVRRTAGANAGARPAMAPVRPPAGRRGAGPGSPSGG